MSTVAVNLIKSLKKSFDFASHNFESINEYRAKSFGETYLTSNLIIIDIETTRRGISINQSYGTLFEFIPYANHNPSIINDPILSIEKYQMADTIRISFRDFDKIFSEIEKSEADDLMLISSYGIDFCQKILSIEEQIKFIEAFIREKF